MLVGRLEGRRRRRCRGWKVGRLEEGGAGAGVVFLVFSLCFLDAPCFCSLFFSVVLVVHCFVFIVFDCVSLFFIVLHCVSELFHCFSCLFIVFHCVFLNCCCFSLFCHSCSCDFQCFSLIVPCVSLFFIAVCLPFSSFFPSIRGA